MIINRVPVARLGLILRQAGATAFSMFFILVWIVYAAIFGRCFAEFGFQGSNIRIYLYLFITKCPYYFL